MGSSRDDLGSPLKRIFGLCIDSSANCKVHDNCQPVLACGRSGQLVFRLLRPSFSARVQHRRANRQIFCSSECEALQRRRIEIYA